MASFCTSCAQALDPGAKFCGTCGATVESANHISTATADRAPQVFSHAHVKRYPALRVIAVILKVLAAITAVGGVFSGLAASSILSRGYGVPGGGAIPLMIIVAGLCYALFLWASAEMLHVFIDIEENTRRASA